MDFSLLDTFITVVHAGTVKKAADFLNSSSSSLYRRLEQLEKETAELQDSIARNKQKIIYIKTKSDEKVDSIRVLPLDSAMEIFADQVSREDSPQR